jgi:hypothetical protein
MNFKEQQEIIIQFIKDNYVNYLPDDLKDFELTLSFLDFDRFKKDFTLFMDFAKIDFRQSNYDDDCGDIEHLTLTIYLVHRNDKSEILQDNNLNSAFAFYEMIKKNPRLGVAQNTIIDSIDFYNYAEANKFLVVTEINLSLDIEI